MQSNSSVIAPPGKPSKPYPDFPLFAHASGQWAKKIRGSLKYFGVWADPDAALDKYLKEKDSLHAGKKPRTDPEAVTVKEAVNAFLNAKDALVDAGELSPRTRAEYQAATDEIIAQYGKARLVIDLGPDDFAELRGRMANKWGVHRLAKMIQYIRSVFKHAFDASLIDRPLNFGPGFKRPKKKVFRLDRASKGPKLFTRDEILAMVNGATVPMRAMLLLAINVGMGNSDCANLRKQHLDMKTGWLDFPRPKTGIDRRADLWPETLGAIEAVLALQDRRQAGRKEPLAPEYADLVFVTKYAGTWAKDTSANPISYETGKLLKKLKINGRKGLGFYTLRHVFRTIADQTKDQVAVDYVMGHEIPGMAALYREGIDDSRLLAVSDHVHKWLFGQ